MLDEPTTGLDPRSKREVQAFIRELRRTHDTTILLLHARLAEAESLSERVGILHAGRLLALEPAAELIARFGAGTLEEAFFTATGVELDEDGEEVDCMKTDMVTGTIRSAHRRAPAVDRSWAAESSSATPT